MTGYSALQRLGSAWYTDQQTLVLKVPSAVIPYQYNYLINTEHPDFSDHVQLVSHSMHKQVSCGEPMGQNWLACLQ